MTKYAFYTFALLAQTTKGRKIRTWIVDIYAEYQKILVYTRQRLIETSTGKDNRNAAELYKQRNEAKYERTLLNKDIKVKTLHSENNILTQKCKEYKQDLRDSQDRTKMYKEMHDDDSTELDNVMELYNNEKLDKEMIIILYDTYIHTTNEDAKNGIMTSINKLKSIYDIST
jgi:hypothetical protein